MLPLCQRGSRKNDETQTQSAEAFLEVSTVNFQLPFLAVTRLAWEVRTTRTEHPVNSKRTEEIRRGRANEITRHSKKKSQYALCGRYQDDRRRNRNCEIETNEEEGPQKEDQRLDL